MSDVNGKIIGQYQLIEVIGQNASTLVCKGFQSSTNRYVAVRFLKPEVAHHPEDMQRFLQAGKLLAGIHHPRLLEVYENGQAEGLTFRAERLAENGSLQDRLAFGSQNPFYETGKAINLFQEIVEGLEFIHSRGYIHGNLKPSNILLDAMMHPLLIDFGLPARPTDAASPYMAPEQLSGVVDRRADVYALGILLYTVLVGVAPQAGVAANPRSNRPELPIGVESIIFRATDQNPNQRYQSATEFINALRTAFAAPMLATAPVYAAVPVAPIPAVSQTVNVAGQKKDTNWIAIILGGLLVFFLCIAAIFIYQSYSQDQGVPVATEPPVIASVEPSAVPPPAITQVLPTRGPRPTNEPLPTDVPQPTAPPEAAQLPVIPDQQPVSTNPMCGSAGLIVAPLIVLSATKLTKKRRKK